jgi:hypothetical protein
MELAAIEIPAELRRPMNDTVSDTGRTDRMQLRRDKSQLGRVTAALAVISLVVSILALVLSYLANREETAVNLHAAASINSLGSTPAGYAVRISFINESLRPVIVSSMMLKVDGVAVAPISSVLAGDEAGSDAASLGDEPLESARSLPFALPARGAQSITGLADFSRPEREAAAHHASERLMLARRFCRNLPVERPAHLGRGEPRRMPAIELDIRFTPGGSETVPVPVTEVVGGDNPWRMEVSGPTVHPTGVSFSRYTSAPTALRLVSVKVWEGEGGLVRSASLPVSGAVTTGVRFRSLPSGYYRAGLFDGHEVLAVGHFNVPLNEKNELIYPLGAQRANGQCNLLENKRNVFTYKRPDFERAASEAR